MLNQKHNVHKRTNSKILLIILCIFGLLFSWSCSCKNRVSDPNETPINGGITNKKPDETPPGTFSMSASTDNVTDNFIVKSASTVGEIKIAFVSANNYAYTSSYEVVDNDTTEANRITTAETTYANNVLTIKDTALAKVRQLDSSAGPAEKTITINFTFKAKDTSLKNNTQTLSVEVKLTKAQEVKEDNIENILKKMEGYANYSEGEYDDKKAFNFVFSRGSYDNVQKEYTIKNSDPGKPFDTFNEAGIEECRKNMSYYLRKLAETTDDELTPTNTEGGVNQSYLTLTYNVKWSDSFESTITEIKIKFDLSKS